MKAITVEARGGPAVIEERPAPTVRPGYMLVQTAAVAMNPADVLVIDFQLQAPGSLSGCDYAGTVLAVGDGVDRAFRVGDRVCGATRSADPDRADMGTFAEQIVVKADLQLHLPESMSFENAAALGVTVLTTGRCLFDRIGIPYPKLTENNKFVPPSGPKRPLLVYGGSSAMGTMVIQFAKLAGFHVLSTSSPQNKKMVESIGADFVVNHYDEAAVEELIGHVKEHEPTMGPLLYCVDNIAAPETPLFCARVLNQDAKLEFNAAGPPPDMIAMLQDAQTKTKAKGIEGEKIYSTIGLTTIPLPNITTVATLGYSFLGEPWEQAGLKFPESQADFEDSRRFAGIAEALLAEGHIVPHPIETRDGGLQGVLDTGLPDLRQKKVSGKKLVYQL